MRLLAALAILLLAACSDPNAEANKRAVQAKADYDRALADPDLGNRARLLDTSQSLLKEITAKFPESQAAVQLAGGQAVAGLTPAKLEEAISETRNALEMSKCETRPTRRCLIRKLIEKAQDPTLEDPYVVAGRVAVARLYAAIGERARAHSLLKEAETLLKSRESLVPAISYDYLTRAAIELDEPTIPPLWRRQPGGFQGIYFAYLQRFGVERADRIVPEFARDAVKRDDFLVKLAGHWTETTVDSAEKLARAVKTPTKRAEALAEVAHRWQSLGGVQRSIDLYKEAAELVRGDGNESGAATYRTRARIVGTPFPPDEAAGERRIAALAVLRTAKDQELLNQAIDVALAAQDDMQRWAVLMKVASAIPDSLSGRREELLREALALKPAKDVPYLVYLLDERTSPSFRLQVLDHVLKRAEFTRADTIEHLSEALPYVFPE